LIVHDVVKKCSRYRETQQIPVRFGMISAKPKLGLFVVGGYALIVALVLFCYFKMPQSPTWTVSIVMLTLPWSVVVVLLGYLLIHISSHGMEYGFILGAIINCLLLYLLVNAWARTKATKSAGKQ
jgi:hypothetical protein